MIDANLMVLGMRTKVGERPFDRQPLGETVQIFRSNVRTGVRPVVCKMTLKAAMDLLPAERFVRVHRSYIVAWSKVTRVSRGQVVLGEVAVPIGETYAAGVRGRLRGV